MHSCCFETLRHLWQLLGDNCSSSSAPAAYAKMMPPAMPRMSRTKNWNTAPSAVAAWQQQAARHTPNSTPVAKWCVIRKLHTAAAEQVQVKLGLAPDMQGPGFKNAMPRLMSSSWQVMVAACLPAGCLQKCRPTWLPTPTPLNTAWLDSTPLT